MNNQEDINVGDKVVCIAGHYFKFQLLKSTVAYSVKSVSEEGNITLEETGNFLFPKKCFKKFKARLAKGVKRGTPEEFADNLAKQKEETLARLSELGIEWEVASDEGDKQEAERLMSHIDFLLEKLHVINSSPNGTSTDQEG
jgi:hypothetical protein